MVNELLDNIEKFIRWTTSTNSSGEASSAINNIVFLINFNLIGPVK